MEGSLRGRTISGMFWSFLQKFGTMTISFVSNIVLARLLTPEDYGCIGMLMIFITLANTFIDGGLGSALIQKKRTNRRRLFYDILLESNNFHNIVYIFIHKCIFNSPIL